MSLFSDAMCSAYDDIFKVHGIQAVIKSANGTAKVNALFTNNDTDYIAGDVSINGPNPLMKIKTDDVDRIGIARGDTAQANNITYTITKISKTNTVMSVLDLSEVK